MPRDLSSGPRCTGHDIKLSYAHLGIFYYHQEQRNTLSLSLSLRRYATVPRLFFHLSFPPRLSLSLSASSSRRFHCQVMSTCLYFSKSAGTYSAHFYFILTSNMKKIGIEEKTEKKKMREPSVFILRFVSSICSRLDGFSIGYFGYFRKFKSGNLIRRIDALRRFTATNGRVIVVVESNRATTAVLSSSSRSR